MENELITKIFHDENSEPPKNYLWDKNGVIYKHNNGKWKETNEFSFGNNNELLINGSFITPEAYLGQKIFKSEDEMYLYRSMVEAGDTDLANSFIEEAKEDQERRGLFTIDDVKQYFASLIKVFGDNSDITNGCMQWMLINYLEAGFFGKRNATEDYILIPFANYSLNYCYIFPRDLFIECTNFEDVSNALGGTIDEAFYLNLYQNQFAKGLSFYASNRNYVKPEPNPNPIPADKQYYYIKWYDGNNKLENTKYYKSGDVIDFHDTLNNEYYFVNQDNQQFKVVKQIDAEIGTLIRWAYTYPDDIIDDTFIMPSENIELFVELQHEI